MTRLKNLGLFLILALLGGNDSALAQDVQVSASVSTDVIGLQDQFQLTVTVSGRDSGDAETPRPPGMSGFRVVAGPSVSSQFQWINGRTSSTRSFIWILLPEKEGQFTIDPLEIRVGNKTYKTQPLSVKVVAGSGQPARPQSNLSAPFERGDPFERAKPSAEEVFINAEIDRSSAYPGQQVTLSYHLYTRVGVTGIQVQENPPLTGFWVEDLEVPPNPQGIRKVVNGREYVEYLIKKQALFPNAAGKVKVPPSTFAVSAKGASDFFGVFAQTETLYRKTKEIVLEVKPLPAQNRPLGFTNAIGSFNLSSNLDKNEVAAGEAVTLRIRLSGRGNLKIVSDIALPALVDFTVYSSKRTENVRPIEGGLIGGDKIWEYVIVPKAPGQQVIPALSLSYFDPEREKYETATAAALTLKVTPGTNPGGTVTILSGLNKQNVTRQGSDINFIKLNAGDLNAAANPIYRSAWFYLLALVPLSFNICAFLYRRRQELQAVDFVSARSRRARRIALRRLKGAAKAGKSEPRRFYDQAAGALSGYLADRFNLPEIAVTGDSLERALSENTVSPDMVREILDCLQECDFGRFVSAAAAPDKMHQLVYRIKKTIENLERF